MKNLKAIFIGASAGGVNAVQKLLITLGNDFSVPIVVVLHLPANSDINPKLVFGHSTNLQISEALDKIEIEPRNIYFATPGYHLLVETDSSFSLSQDEPILYSRPSIDVLFQSAAEAYGSGACGILLTGANADGAEGLKIMKDLGAYTIVQDPLEAEVSAMPKAALAKFKPDFVGNLQAIGAKLLDLQEKGPQ